MQISRPSSALAATSVLTLAAFAFLSPASAQVNIFNQNFDSGPVNIGSYSGDGATGSALVQPGAGVAGTAGLVLNTTFTKPGGYSGVQLSTISNPNTLVTDPKNVSISFDLRDTNPAQSNVLFYFQTFTGDFAHLDGTSSISFTPTTGYQHYTFTVADLTDTVGTQVVTDPTVQIGWQIAQSGADLSPNSLNIDNVLVTASNVTPVPETSSCVSLALGLLLIAPLVWKRRRISA